VTVDLARAPELAEPGGAMRLEGAPLSGDPLGERLLVVHGLDGQYHAYRNRCTHAGRRLDPNASTPTVRCCSVGQSLFGYDGRLITGPASGNLTVYPVELEDERLRIEL
jgi:nitrite reductase/ring-hydroxylating ferredoxin subunit